VFVAALMAVFEVARAFLPDSSKPSAQPHGPMLPVKIASGSNAVQIGDALQAAGVVEDGDRFRNYAKEQGEGSDFKAGSYRFQAGTDYDRIIERLNTGPPPPKIVTLLIPEGLRLTEVADRVSQVGISRKQYLRAVARAAPPAGFGHHANMEGFVFPATYDIKPHTTADQLVAQQLAAFAAAFSQVDMSYAASKNLSPYDVLKIASMIEREARVDKERPLIAAVIYNRLHLDMALGIDATLLYEQGSWTHKLTVSELAADTPYNTRVRHGLPPSPICNPGLKSLQAAAHPAKVNYLYYVAEGDSGRHFFTDNYDEFLAHAGG
jgi:UPF0755 protein